MKVPKIEAVNDLRSPNTQINSQAKSQNGDLAMFQLVMALILCTAFVCYFFVVVNAGECSVLMQFSKVQSQILHEGIHPILPIAQTVKKLSVRVQK